MVIVIFFFIGAVVAAFIVAAFAQMITPTKPQIKKFRRSAPKTGVRSAVKPYVPVVSRFKSEGTYA